MAINSADKIFVDVNDEINFIIEKILASSSSQVILAVPQNALIVSSLVSMKVLSKQINKSKKNVVVVTEDKFGRQIAERAGLVATNKVSSITPELWETAQIKKTRAQEEVKKVKEELLTERGILERSQPSELEAETKPELNVEPEVEEKVLEEQESENEVGPEIVGEDEVLEEEEPEAVLQEDQPEDQGETEEEVKGPIQRKRLRGKAISMAGFQIFAGADVDDIKIEKNAIIPSMRTEKEQEDIIEEAVEDGDSEPEIPDRRAIAQKNRRGGFTGKDWRKATKDSEGPGIMERLFGFAKSNSRRKTPSSDPYADSFFQRLIRNKYVWIGLSVLVVAIALAVYVFAFVLASVEIRLELKTADIPVEQQITASETAIDVDPENLIIPARIETQEVDSSTTAKATGEGTRGEKAAGLIEVWNRTDAAVSLKQGTIITNPVNGLKYKLLQATTLPAAEQDKNGVVTTPGGVNQEVRIEAEKIGENYNIPASDDTNVDLKISGYATSDVVGKRFRDITGGSSETFVAVDKTDVDKQKKELRKLLEPDAMALVREEVSPDEVLLIGSEKFRVVEVVADPDIGEEADKFNTSMVLEVTAVVVKKEDLDKAIAELIKLNQDTEIEFEVDGLSGSSFDNVKRDGNTATFTVSSQGSLRSKIDEEIIKSDIKGMSIQEAIDYFNFQVPEVESARVIYSPGIVPESLRRIPTDLNKILLVF